MTLLARLRNRKAALQTALQTPKRTDSRATQKSASGDADSVAALTATANRHFQTGELIAARELYKRILELDPADARAYYMLSGIAAQDGDLSSAVGLAQRAIGLTPAVPEFHFSLAGVYFSQRDVRKALNSYREALRLRPDSLEYQRAVAGALLAAGALDEGVDAYRAIANTRTRDGLGYFELGKALQLRGNLKEAEETFAQAVKLSPDFEDAHLHLAVVLREQGRLVDAEGPARRAVALAPNMHQAWFVLGRILGEQGRHPEAVELFRKVLAMQPEDDAAWSELLFSMNYSEQFSRHEVFAEHLKYGDRFPRAPAMAIDAGRVNSGRRLRVGYLSPDFWLHPVAHFMAPVLSRHDRARFEVFCYYTGRQHDAMTGRLKTVCEHWRETAGVPDEGLERILRGDELDILVELSGHSNHQRLALLATRVAPVQVTYLGYPNTTGLAAIDYRLTDARADPPGESDRFHSEKLFRLPDTFLCYAPPTVKIEATAAPFHQTGYVTFGSFNNFAKISPITVKLWSKVLALVPNSRLLVKTRGLQDPGLRVLLLGRFRDHGIEADRIQLMPLILDQREHLQTYGGVDIALDTFPYNGTTTTMEALWMGVPVVTLEGDRHASRVGASILSALGLADCVARTQDEYVQIAVRLAGAASELDVLRQRLRPRLSASPLTDGARFTAHLEQAYLKMWEEFRSGGSASLGVAGA